MAIIGIDLGTTTSLAVCWRNGRAELIKNSMNSGFTPSAISIDSSGDVLVGQIALERLISHPKDSVSEFKRSMGQQTKIELGSRSFSPEELSALVLKKIKTDAEAYLGESVEEAVISVPAYFDDNARSATKLAAELAGIKAERLVNEPSAAALAYLEKQDFCTGTFLVVDFGGGTLDISLVDAFDGVVEIIAVAGDNHLGGKDFNEAISNYFCKENGMCFDLLPSDDRAVIYKTAEACKRALTRMPIAVMSANVGGKTYSVTLDNNMLIGICSDIFERISVPIKKVMRDGRCTLDELTDIILVGGSCRMPTVRAFLEKLTGKEMCTDINPETAVAVGAGIFAGIKSRNDELRDIILTDICPFSLGMSTLDSDTGELTMTFIIERNTTLPASREKTFYAIRDFQNAVDVCIYQGESPLPQKNLLIGKLTVKCPPTKQHEPICTVRLTYDINGILMVDVTTFGDKKTHTEVFMSSSRKKLSDKDAEKARERMQALRILPIEQEENRLLIARAERAVEESLAFERDVLMQYLSAFKAALKTGNSREMRGTYNMLKELLDRKDGDDLR